MTYPKVKYASASDDHTLVVVFENGEKKRYDVAPLFDNEMFAPLRNPALFRAVEVEKGGYAVVWNSAIDISEYELWQHGETVL
jgi:hypothetical protein